METGLAVFLRLCLQNDTQQPVGPFCYVNGGSDGVARRRRHDDVTTRAADIHSVGELAG